MNKHLGLSIGLMVYCFNGVIVPVHAQSVTLSVSPPVVEIMIAPNKQVSQTFKLSTQGKVDVTPELHLAKPIDSSGHVTIDPKPLDPSSMPLLANINPAGPPWADDSRTYTLTLNAANTDSITDIYLALVFRVTPLESSFSNLASTTPAISALILVTVNPGSVLPINLEITGFSPSLLHDSWAPLTLTPDLKNNTPIMIRPEGTYEVISPTGKTVLSLPLYPNLVLGDSSRSILGSSPNPAGTPRADDSRALTWSPRWYDIGPYRLHLTITTQGGTKITDLEKVVWVLPIRITIIIVVSLILLLTLTYKHNRFKRV